uniref:Tnfrsf1a-associated via death domain n=1 Tax=Xiphophorus couchianus TaxID=32473 RepID=A0A3B5LVJ1_9TELE
MLFYFSLCDNVGNTNTKMADKTADGGAWTGCAVMFLQSLFPGVDLLALYKGEQGKFIIFKVLKLTLRDSAGGLGGYDILKVHDAEPFLGVEVKFVDVAACQQFLESYSSGAVLQSLNQHACRLLGLPQDFTVRTQLKAGPQNLDLCLDQLAVCLQHIHLSQPERLRDEEIDHLEQQLQSQALGPAPQTLTVTQEESPVPSNCFKFQNRVFVQEAEGDNRTAALQPRITSFQRQSPFYTAGHQQIMFY